MVLAGKTAVVSGASRGIGRAVAIGLAKAGADVAVNYYSDRDSAKEVAAEIEAAGRRAMLCEADISDYDAVAAMIERIASEWGRIDIGVSNAAWSDRKPFHTADLEKFRRTIDISMWGAFYLLRTTAQQMIRQGGGGSFVCISSPHAYLAVPNAMAYNISKAANDQMSRTAAIELIDHRIRVNIVHPGWTDTPGERNFASEEFIQKAAEKLPWGRLARPEEIARAVVFLCDPASDYINGTTLGVDGGNTLPWWAKGGMAVPE